MHRSYIRSMLYMLYRHLYVIDTKKRIGNCITTMICNGIYKYRARGRLKIDLNAAYMISNV
jgi:hypothetical protein